MHNKVKDVLKTLIFNPNKSLFYKYNFIPESTIKDLMDVVQVCGEHSFSAMTGKKIDVPNLFISKQDLAFFEKDLNSLLKELNQANGLEKEFKKVVQARDPKDKKNIQKKKFLANELIEFFELIIKQDKTEKKKNAKEELKKQIEHWDINTLQYEDMFPKARNMKRHIKFFIGPTNSGKTYNAINELVSHGSGVYLAPLRLLALEGQDEIKQRGHDCSFITGEEKDIIPGAKFLAQTVETFNFNKEVPAILIDEIQMLGDENRGWAWTQALIGAPSKNIILTGSLDSLHLIEDIAELLGDELEVIKLDRFTKLTCMDSPINIEKSVKDLEEGTAIITFSRKNVLHIKSFFEKESIPVSIIYGNLSPEVRREEARKFREGETKFLISTDAIAMGLNLPIKFVIFAEVSKFNGKEVSELSAPEVRQIGGRAGRYNKYPEGFYTATTQQDINYLKKAMERFSHMEFKMYIRPNMDQVTQLSEMIKSDNLYKILKTFEKITNKNDVEHYLAFDVDALLPALQIIDSYDISLEEKMFFLEIPLDYNNEVIMNYFNSWLRAYVENTEIAPETFFPYNKKKFNNDNLLAAENNIKLLTAYLWIANKLEKTAPFKKLAIELKKENNDYIIECLSQNLDASKKCESCNCALPTEHIHKKCEECFISGKRSKKDSFYDYDFDIYPLDFKK